MKRKFKAVIFDLGNVLVGFDHRIAVKRILQYTDKTIPEIYDLFFDSRLTRDFEKGLIQPLEFFAGLRAMLKLKISYDEFLPIWNEIFFGLPDSQELVSALAPGLKRLMLSNINRLHYEYLRSSFASVFDLFAPEKIIPSYRAGFIKPEREIYDLAVSSSGENREDIVYVDDRQDLIEAARSFGINSIQFKSAPQLRQEFLGLGIIAEDAVFQKA